MFKLHPRLENDLIDLGELKLSKVLLHPNTENPWVVLVPKVENISEFHYLQKEDQLVLLDEINFFSKLLQTNFDADKLNVASLGNLVPQLHIHIIVRKKEDKAWPNALWGTQLDCESSSLEKIKTLIEKGITEYHR